MLLWGLSMQPAHPRVPLLWDSRVRGWVISTAPSTPISQLILLPPEEIPSFPISLLETILFFPYSLFPSFLLSCRPCSPKAQSLIWSRVQGEQGCCHDLMLPSSPLAHLEPPHLPTNLPALPVPLAHVWEWAAPLWQLPAALLGQGTPGADGTPQVGPPEPAQEQQNSTWGQLRSPV